MPYMESRLTQLLRPAFGGNSFTTCIVTASMDDAQGEQTLQALKFGENCTMITNFARFGTQSISNALLTIDHALETCKHGITHLEDTGKTHLPSYKKLKERWETLSQKRADIAKLKGKQHTQEFTAYE